MVFGFVCLYGQGVKANMDGVLGGFANVNEPDISCSEDFLNILLSERFPPAADARRQPLVALGTHSLPLCTWTPLLKTNVVLGDIVS